MTVRTIKRYSNRKLYDTTDSRYVTLQQIAGLIRNGDEIRVIDKTTQQDLTAATMAQIIFEEEKRGPRLPVEGLRRIIRTGLPAQTGLWPEPRPQGALTKRGWWGPPPRGSHREHDCVLTVETNPERARTSRTVSPV